MALKQWFTRPFGRPAPPFREEDAMPDLVRLVRQNVTSRVEVGFAIRTRSCDGRTRYEMLDGTGGGAAGYANACEDGVTVGAGGVSEIAWSQRSDGRTVRTLFDTGKSGRGTIGAIRFSGTPRLGSIAGRVTVAATGLGLAGVTVSDGTRTAVSRSNGDYAIRNVPTGTAFTVTPVLAGYSFTPATRSVTVDVLTGTGGGVDFAATPATEWVMVGSGADPILYSDDGGLTWQSVGSGIFTTAYCVIYSAADDLWLAGGTGANTLAYSTDGTTWHGLGTSIFGATGAVHGIAKLATGYVAIASVGAGHSPWATSANGMAWTEGELNSAYYGEAVPLWSSFPTTRAIAQFGEGWVGFSNAKMLFEQEIGSVTADFGSSIRAAIYDATFGSVVGHGDKSGSTVSTFTAISKNGDDSPYPTDPTGCGAALGANSVWALCVGAGKLFAAGGSGFSPVASYTTDLSSWTYLTGAFSVVFGASAIGHDGSRCLVAGSADGGGWVAGYTDDLSTWTASTITHNQEFGDGVLGVAAKVG